jgi:N-methylhydantoinase B
VFSSGGGGWGNPLERDPEMVQQDVMNGFISVKSAEEKYGVIIRDGKIDQNATDTLRASSM